MLSLVGFIFVIIWGNIPQTFLILPVVSGALGGYISAVFGLLNLYIIRNVSKLWLKIAVSLLMFGLTILVCWFVAVIILAATVAV